MFIEYYHLHKGIYVLIKSCTPALSLVRVAVTPPILPSAKWNLITLPKMSYTVQSTIYIKMIFTKLAHLAHSVWWLQCLFIYVYVPFPCNIFEAPHWPSDHMISLWPLIGPTSFPTVHPAPSPPSPLKTDLVLVLPLKLKRGSTLENFISDFAGLNYQYGPYFKP